MRESRRLRARSQWCAPLAILALLCAPPPLSATDLLGGEAESLARAGFGFADVVRRAEELAADAWRPDDTPLPDALADLEYAAYQQIRFRPEHTLWRDGRLPFRIQLFPRGFLFTERVDVYLIDDEGVHAVPFSHELFDYGALEMAEPLPAGTGFAGFKLFYPLADADRFDEFAVFLGASYFRAVARGQHYGLSARGLAIDTALETPEEFPRYRAFWIRRPTPDDTTITVLALLDGPRVAGAYRFVLRPGATTVIDVEARIILREQVGKLGIAPLTSMFHHGENTSRHVDDYRPEAHDSDGLVIENGNGERIWHPLRNPQRLMISEFGVNDAHGFGLLQRDRRFENYQDLELDYERRPSAWVELLDTWGKGRIELVEIPTPNETNDNIVAFWKPATAWQAGSAHTVRYRIHFAPDPEASLGGARVVATRLGTTPGVAQDEADGRRHFVIDFAAADDGAGALDNPPQAVCTSSSGALEAVTVRPHRHLAGWRLEFDLHPDEDTPSNLRCFLRRGAGDVLSETWAYTWTPG
ncbi:MAG: glucan biosynthesis protein G [Gammaproteobacteria bacterium]